MTTTARTHMAPPNNNSNNSSNNIINNNNSNNNDNVDDSNASLLKVSSDLTEKGSIKHTKAQHLVSLTLSPKTPSPHTSHQQHMKKPITIPINEKDLYLMHFFSSTAAAGNNNRDDIDIEALSPVRTKKSYSIRRSPTNDCHLTTTTTTTITPATTTTSSPANDTLPGNNNNTTPTRDDNDTTSLFSDENLLATATLIEEAEAAESEAAQSELANLSDDEYDDCLWNHFSEGCFTAIPRRFWGFDDNDDILQPPPPPVPSSSCHPAAAVVASSYHDDLSDVIEERVIIIDELKSMGIGGDDDDGSSSGGERKVEEVHRHPREVLICESKGLLLEASSSSLEERKSNLSISNSL